LQAEPVRPRESARTHQRDRIREWDPGTASEAEMEAWLRAYNDALSADLPDDPSWGMGRLREYLTVTMPGERRLTWLAEDATAPPGQHVRGYGRLLMLDGLGVLELYVIPAARRHGLGRALLRTIVDRAIAEGFMTLGVEAPGATASAAFYQNHGFGHAYTEMRSILELATVDWPHVSEMAAAIVHGYEVEIHPGDLPDELLPEYAEAKQVRRLDPPGDLELRPSSYDAERLRASLHCLQARGLKPYIVLAKHERTGRVAGLTELVVPSQHPTRADQYDTIIVPEHNGYGLARALKARMLLELRVAEPQLRDVQTWHAAENEQLQQVNKELGFQPDREWREYEADARELAARLDPPDPPAPEA
jgi:GNAT superfamily N-acetyltransferase/RimJ/RimL family protein N-acetyltransferase